MKEQAIAVFDSGLGGLSVLFQAMKTFPNEHFIYYGDSANAPYGVKSRNEIYERCKYIVASFVEEHVKAVVIACNTATSACADELREQFPHLIIIGMEPALKPAVAQISANKKVIVLATSFTLNKKKFKELVHNLDSEDKVIPIACPELVSIVENIELTNELKVEETFNSYFNSIDMNEVEVIVLGCTHFIFFKDYLSHRFPNIKIIDGNQGTVNNLKNQLLNRSYMSNEEEGSLTILNSENDDYIVRSKQLLNYMKKAD